MVEVSPLESYRRRRRPVRVRRRYVRRPPTRRRTVRPPRLRVRTPFRRRRTARVVPRRRWLPTVRRRPSRVVRRYVPLPYPGYRTLDLPPATARVRPAAILSHFSVDSATLRPHHMPPIEQVARHVIASWRTRRPIRTIRLVGHTDNRGSARYNRRLGKQRAMAARNRLVLEINRLRPNLTRNVDVVARSAGGTRPIASNRTPTGRAFNHRVEVFLSRTR